MKKFFTNKVLISLENVLRIDLIDTSYTYTRQGKKINETAYSIQITYVDGQITSLSCGVDADGKAAQAECFEKIIEIL